VKGVEALVENIIFMMAVVNILFHSKERTWIEDVSERKF
jgi:hypothetical protein